MDKATLISEKFKPVAIAIIKLHALVSQSVSRSVGRSVSQSEILLYKKFHNISVEGFMANL